VGFYTKYIYLSLCVSFLIYSAIIYLKPLREKYSENSELRNISEGRLVWQKYNCQSCHQLYGLGGYLGPDLTNFMEDSIKGEIILESMLTNGTKQMPAFKLEMKELIELKAFLNVVNSTGNADPRKFSADAYGMIESK
jgi:nitric oxide reductase subunit C